MQPPTQPPQRQQPITRRYATDAEYSADAAQMAAAGWRIVSLSRDDAGAIVAIYAPPGMPAGSPQHWAMPINRSMFMLGAGVGLLLVIALVAGVLFAQLNSAAAQLPSDGLSTPTTNVNIAATILAHDPTAASTSLPAQTITPAPAPVSGPHLGGPMAAFDRAYGPEVSPGFWDITLDGQPVQLVIASNRAGESADAQLRAAVIDLDGPDTAHPWTAAQEAALVNSFLPPDAHHTQEVAGSNPLGPDHLYVSQQLAASFAASVFQDANNQQLAPGTFDWQCSTDRQLCEVGVGTNS